MESCQNCLRIVREERQLQEPLRSDVSVCESKWSRRRGTSTEVVTGCIERESARKVNADVYWLEEAFCGIQYRLVGDTDSDESY